MANKKKKPRRPSKPSVTVPPPPAGDSPSFEEIDECDQALRTIRQGNHIKALRLMKESCQKFANFALVHRVNATIFVKTASLIDDSSAKKQYLLNAVESAKKAVTLSPNSLEFARYYAGLLLEIGANFDRVVNECERALAIEKPSDPVVENLLIAEKDEVDDSAGFRLENIRQQLKTLIELCRAIRMPWEDPIELKYFRNGDGFVDERNIRVKIAAHALLRLQEVDHPSNGERKCDDEVSRRIGIGEQRQDENTENKERVRTFWNSLSYEVKKGFLRVSVSDLREHLVNSCEDGVQACDILSESLAFGELRKTWKFWTCCKCGEKFSDPHSHVKHVVIVHEGNLLMKIKSDLPKIVGKKWTEMLINCSWTPLDLTAAVEMFEDRSKLKDSDFDTFCSNVTCDSFSDRSDVADSCNVDSKESNIECKTSDVTEDSKVDNLSSNWPLSDDTECTELLDKISLLFDVMVRKKHLATSHMLTVMLMAMEELLGFIPRSQIIRCGMDQTPLSICFLRAPQLRKIIKLLKELHSKCPENVTPEENPCHPQVSDHDGRIMLSEDALFLQLDESLLPCDGKKDVVVSGSPGVISKTDVQSDSSSDSLLSWIYAGPPCGYQLETWTRIIKDIAQQGIDVLHKIEEEFQLLQEKCDEKRLGLAWKEVLIESAGLCFEEVWKRRCGAELPLCSFDSILRKRRYELFEGEYKVTSSNKWLQLVLISVILIEAENLNVKQPGYEEAYGATAQLHDVESDEDDWNPEKHLHRMEACVDIVFQRQKEDVSIQLCKLDTEIMRSVIALRQLRLTLEPVSALDYSSILVPLLKSYMQAHLEDLAMKDATEKSYTAGEAFLSELELGSEKGCGNANDSSKNIQEKMKVKEGDKKSRNKDLKVVINKEFDAEKLSVATSFDGDQADTDRVMSASGGNVNELEDEHRIEALAIMLDNNLEYQRQMENEFKQKHLAEQHITNDLHSPAPLNIKDASMGNLDGLQKNLNLDARSIDDNGCARGIDVYRNELPNVAIPNDEDLTLERQAGRKEKQGVP